MTMNNTFTKHQHLTVPILFVIFLFMGAFGGGKAQRANEQMMPSLPRPIAKESVLITSAGQSTDTYIVKDIANNLMIHNYFMPQAEDVDLERVNSVVIVVGYSEISEKLHSIDFDSEKNRIEKLLFNAKDAKKPIILIHVGFNYRHNEQTEKLINLIAPECDYIIGTLDSDYITILSDIAKANNIPYTFVKGITDVSKPFASIFR